jgi:Phosphotransferase enzyme family
MPVTDERLSAALQAALKRTVRELRRRPWPYQSSFPIEELEVDVHGRGWQRMLFKDLTGTGSKPGFLRDGAREIDAYLEVLGPQGVDAPTCYGALHDPAWLFLEIVEGDLLWQVGDIHIWEEAARWLARLHGRSLACRSPHLLRYDAAYFRCWLPRACEFAPSGTLDGIVAGYERVVGRLAEWPRGFVHGEFYPSNILVEGSRVRPVDWEMAGVAPGLLDLAALTSGGWEERNRERLARAYFEACLPALRGSGWDDFLDALEHFRLHLAVQWLGWSRDWSPPAEHAHDWLADALRLAERLGLR